MKTGMATGHACRNVQSSMFNLQWWLKVFIAAVMPCLSCAQSSVESEVGMRLLMANYDLMERDTLSALTLMQSIDTVRVTKLNKDLQLIYYQLKASVVESRHDYAAEARNLGLAMEILDRRRPSANYLETAWGQGYALMKTGDYEEAGRVVRHALVKGSAVVDSCRVSSWLFTLMAEIAEHQGDSIFAQHLHERAQQQSLRTMAFEMGPDSTDMMLRRYDEQRQELHQSKHFFTRDNPAYLYLLSQMAFLVNSGGNAKEAIRMGEESLRMARDSMLTEQAWTCGGYAVLLNAYPYDGQLEKAKKLLPEAVRYYAKFPEMGMTEEGLLSLVGEALFYKRDYANAWQFLKRMNEVAAKKKRPLNDYWRELVNLCREFRQ